MKSWHITFVISLAYYQSVYPTEDLETLKPIQEENGSNIFLEILNEVDREKLFNSMPFLYRGRINDSRIRQLFIYPKPKVIGTYNLDFLYRKEFNSELLTVFIANGILDFHLLQTAADVLDYRRQTRIMALALNIQHQEKFRQDFLQACAKYKMTNVLLIFVPATDKGSLQFYALRPYPQYHWLPKSWGDLKGNLYYPQHWRNMQNSTLLTYTSQDPPVAILYYDSKGNLQINGYVARLILLFAQLYNASLEMYQPLQLDGICSQHALNILTNSGDLDIPIALDPLVREDDAVRHSTYYELSAGQTIVPCPSPLTIRQIFGLLLNGYFFGCILICSLLLSIAHSLIDFYFDGIFHHMNFVLNDKVFPGVLGQSFSARLTPWRSLKIVYLLVSFVGINIGIQFAANMKTLFTSPPYHDRVNTLEDLRHSSIKILCPEESMDTKYFLALFGHSLIISKNTTMVYEHMNRFNNTYGYFGLTANWDLVALPPHSPLKEPLDHLLYRINELGFREAWKSSVFYDMVRLRNITLLDENQTIDKRVLRVDDLFWIWMIDVVGLAVSSLVFIAELLIAYCRQGGKLA
uniref:Ionotropic glutamate receptor C-terminal domain-containing protein n=1 Tax=Stomoxys calcitrans TaxID=35570 RepID=A0A1I8QD99_STOCA